MEKNKIQFSRQEKTLYLIVIMLILTVLLATILNLKKAKKQIVNNDEEITEAELEEDTQQKWKAILQGMEERDRMEYYFGIFLSYIEDGKYEKAYNLLYEDFKNNYFPTLEDFENYIPTVFSEMSNIEHENIERNGNVYILWIDITDALHGKIGEKKEMNIVIQENDYNDFKLSFSVI